MNVCMYVCMYVYVCMYIRIYIYTYLHRYRHTYRRDNHPQDIIPGILAFYYLFKGLSRGAAQDATLRSAGGTLVD